MAKYIVTMTLYQHCIVEADDEQEAAEIANLDTDDDDWSDPEVMDHFEVAEYRGDEPAFNEDQGDNNDLRDDDEAE